MNKHAKTLVVALAVALASATAAFADSDGSGAGGNGGSGAGGSGGDGGDNSMSRWTGESYAAFHRGEVGDFYTDPSALAGWNLPASGPPSKYAFAQIVKRHDARPYRDASPGIEVAPLGKWGVGHVFRDDPAG